MMEFCSFFQQALFSVLDFHKLEGFKLVQMFQTRSGSADLVKSGPRVYLERVRECFFSFFSLGRGYFTLGC